MTDTITLQRLRVELRRRRYAHTNEFELHTGITEVLAGLGLIVLREVELDRNNRIDLVTGLPRPAGPPVVLGIEAKIAGVGGDVRRQLWRYTDFPQLDALLLVTSIQRHMAAVMSYAEPAPDGNEPGAVWQLNGMPFGVALINRGVL
jgi:hypothetical protein